MFRVLCFFFIVRLFFDFFFGVFICIFRTFFIFSLIFQAVLRFILNASLLWQEINFIPILIIIFLPPIWVNHSIYENLNYHKIDALDYEFLSFELFIHYLILIYYSLNILVTSLLFKIFLLSFSKVLWCLLMHLRLVTSLLLLLVFFLF